ncbi:RelA/SpoT family protein [Zwartia hollandica]|uniref:RelA/SpoT family protein n=1 Tax=Zwartia hollandica TaxID=324606 RepID=UPI002180B4EB|nr:bifunctional (p)ppGpp synthetase/guanosine-3',5'-bis(diphosphate) 3'-pyrophosphohydrolase [Zwartia hollandica]
MPTQLTGAALESLVAGLIPDDQEQVRQTARWACVQLATLRNAAGESHLEHALGSAQILSDMQADAATRCAALLVGVPDEFFAKVPREPSAQPSASPLSPEIARLVQGTRALLRLGSIAKGASDAAVDPTAQKEMLRKMLLAMAADLRIVLIRLASRLQTLRWHAASKVACDPLLATETLDLYTPLANRLGIWQIKWEMEDLAFRFTDPVRYKEIAHLLEEKRVEREAFIARTIEELTSSLRLLGVSAEVSGRPKHIYSIYNKMRLKHLDFSKLFDVRALRIIVQNERDCYTALGLVHERWVPVSDEFDDYISRPKPNGYRSLHTVVADQSGRPFEVQIRTQAMHEFAEFGMAAHWRYKEAGAKGGQVPATAGALEYDKQLAWMRQLLAWNTEATNRPTDVAPARIQRQDEERIYVLSPQARVIELPAGATPVDFAYHLHTDLGHRCRGARIDGQMVPLQTQLQTGQTVEIVTTKSGGPSRDWLNLQLGFLASPRARAKVRAWFNAIELQQRTVQGQALVEKELQRLGKTAVNLEQLAQQLGFAHAEDLYVAAAKEEFSLRQIDAVFQPASPEQELRPESLVSHSARADSATQTGKSGVLVVGVGSLMTQLARCCRPAPPDPITGFVTRGRGVSIHRADCASFATLAARQPERVIEVTWGGNIAGTVYPVDLSVQAQDRSGLLRDLSEVFARLRLNVVAVHTQSKASMAYMGFTVEVHDRAELQRALSALKEVGGVLTVHRR